MSLFTFEVCDVKHEGRRKKKIQSSSKVHNLDSKGLPEKENENSLVKVNQNILQQKWKCITSFETGKKSFQPTNAYTNIFQNTTWSRAISTLKWHGKVLKKHAYCLAVFHPTKQQRLCLTNSKLAEEESKKYSLLPMKVSKYWTTCGLINCSNCPL